MTAANSCKTTALWFEEPFPKDASRLETGRCSLPCKTDLGNCNNLAAAININVIHSHVRGGLWSIVF